MSNMYRDSIFTDREQLYKRDIYTALYPQWIWTGGCIIVHVFDDGNTVVLQGNMQPSPEETNNLISRIEDCLKGKPNIFFKSIFDENEILLQLNRNSVQSNTVSIQPNQNIAPSNTGNIQRKKNTVQPKTNRGELTLRGQSFSQLNKLLMAIYAKADQDIATIRKMPSYTIEVFSAAKDFATQHTQKGFFWIQNNCNQIIDGSIQVIEPLRQELTRYPNKWIIELNQNVTLQIAKAKDDFNLIKKTNPNKTSDELATVIIIESVKKSTFARLVDSGIYNINQSVSDWLESLESKDYPFLNFLASKGTDHIFNQIRKAFKQPKTSDLMLNMIVQIACVYERADFNLPEKQGELVTILTISYLCSLAIDSDFAGVRKNIIDSLDVEKISKRMGISDDLSFVGQVQTGINGVKKLNSFQDFLLSCGMNIVLFLLIGFVSRYIYQNYNNIFEIIVSINLFNEIKLEAGKSLSEMSENAELIEEIVVECYQIEKSELS